LTKLEVIRQRKCCFSLLSTVLAPHENDYPSACYGWEVFTQMKKQDKHTKNQPNRTNESKTGYGDKKLEGPNRPSV
jgi:hypothetical protein